MESSEIIGVVFFGTLFIILGIKVFLLRGVVKKLNLELNFVKKKYDTDSNDWALKNASLGKQVSELIRKAQKIEEFNDIEKLTVEKKNELELMIKYKEAELDDLIKDKSITIEALDQKLEVVMKMIEPHQERIELQESGFYRFQYNFENVDKYSEALQILRDAQKEIIRNKDAVICEHSGFQQSDIYKSLSKLAIMTFSSESEIIISKVTYSNFNSCKERITKIFDLINKHLSPVRMYLSEKNLEMKIKEMAIGYEYESEKQRIKEEQAEIMAQMREEEAARLEAERVRTKAIEEEEKYQKAIELAKADIENKTDEERDAMLRQIQELETKLEKANSERARATSMAQITKAGHVYIISNIGSFGDNVYKIGMTRRKEPMDRVKELGDASVPFKFDVHAMVYTDNAPELESNLHKYFEVKRVNKVNYRKEFFSVSLEEIQKACDEMGYSIKITKAAEAREYRETVEMNNEKKVA